MLYSKRYFVLLTLGFFSLTLLVNLSATETEKIIITNAKQLKGIWEALHIYQETSRQERINTHIPTLPEREEFESEKDYQRRINNIKDVYERRVEKNLKREINNEQEFKSKMFRIELTNSPYVTAQVPARVYLSKVDREYIQEPFELGTEEQYKRQHEKAGYTYIKKSQMIDENLEEYYKHREEKIVLRKKIGTAGLDTGAAGYSAELGQSGHVWHSMFAFLKIPVTLFATPYFEAWRTEENNFSLQEDIAYFTFSLDKYDMEEERFPVTFPLAQHVQEETEWVYYRKTFNDWKHYTETFKESNTEKVEKWLIKFDELPTYIPLHIDKAKILRKNEEDLVLELTFQPVRAEKEISPDTTTYTLVVELISAIFKDGDKIVYKPKIGQLGKQRLEPITDLKPLAELN